MTKRARQMDADDLLSMLESLPEGKRILAEEDFIIEASERISQVLECEQVSKSELARRMGVNRAAITKMLSGSQNMTLRSFAAMAYALGWRPTIGLIPDVDYDVWPNYERVTVRPRKFYRTIADAAANDEWSETERLQAVG